MRRFDVTDDTMPRKTAASIAASATKVETALRAGQSKAAVRRLAQKEGFKGYSLFFAPCPADKARYPGLKYLWVIGPDLFPYDTMHLFLSNVVARLWELLAGENEKLGDDLPGVMSKASREAIGREIKAGRPTIPLNQARPLPDMCKDSSSYKSVDWMYFLLSVGEVVLADRMPDELFNKFMLLCRAGRLVFKPSLMTEQQQKEADKLLKRFCHAYYTHIYAGKDGRLRLCRPPLWPGWTLPPTYAHVVLHDRNGSFQPSASSAR